MPPMAELFLVRHAQAAFGTDDYDRLTELGHRQARWLGTYFRERDLHFDRVVMPYRPRAIFLYAGENDVDSGRSPQQTVAEFKTFMSRKALMR